MTQDRIIRWPVNQGEQIGSFDVEVAQGGGPFVNVGNVLVSDGDLDAELTHSFEEGFQYRVRIQANNLAGSSPYSDEVTTAPAPSKPATPSILVP